ncbi:MAG: DUF3570 domain-containing protein [Gammaproteobacteria bacterium]|nr:DUF3570 domain-containing protein [Gammaproteobacteria bacterium]
MQLKNRPSVRNSLAIATATLFSGLSSNAHTEEKPLELEISKLYYKEQDRVTVNKLQIDSIQALEEDDLLELEFVFDTMTGASPNGRLYSNTAAGLGEVPVTTASGFSFNTANSTGGQGLQPWLSRFEDDRLALSGNWIHPIDRNLTRTLGAAVSSENDYRSRGLSIQFDNDTNQKRDRYTLAFAVNNDTVDPETGIPEGLAPIWCIELARASYIGNYPIQCDNPGDRYLPANKVTNSYLAGFSRVLNSRTITQFNYAGSYVTGYLTDPYKQISLTNPSFNDKEVAVLNEKRPDKRLTHSLFWKLAWVPDAKDSINVSYRFYVDDWEVNSHTIDLRIRREQENHKYLQFHFRGNIQRSAYFYRTQLRTNEELPTYVSADHRLGDQTTLTFGVKLGKELGSTGKIAVRGEYMTQQYHNNNLPKLNALIVQLLMSVKF